MKVSLVAIAAVAACVAALDDTASIVHRARQQVAAAARVASAVGDEISSSPSKLIPGDGPKGLAKMLKGTHFEGVGQMAGQSNSAEYVLKPYDSVTQSPKAGLLSFNKPKELFSLGKFEGWYVSADGNYDEMSFGGGDPKFCPGDKPRSARVKLVCAAKAGVVGKVAEPTPCTYAFTFGLPAVCEADMKQGHEDATLKTHFDTHVGPAALHAKLKGKKFIAEGKPKVGDDVYKYTLTPFGEIRQTPVKASTGQSILKAIGMDGVSCGTFKGWYIVDGEWHTMVFRDGTGCANGIKRHTNVTFVCDEKSDGAIVGAVEEPEMCGYKFTFSLKDICGVNLGVGHEEDGAKAPTGKFREVEEEEEAAPVVDAVVADARRNLRRADAALAAVLAP